jgi:AcrR family transcriptional regulator
MTRTTREDVVQAAGRLFAQRGYDATSMRDLGRELGLLGSSLYAHVEGKQELLVEVVMRGGELFTESAAAATAVDGTASDQLRAFIAGHVGVVLDHLDVARTFLNEARSLDPEFRARVVAARDTYEATLRSILSAGIIDGSFRKNLDPKLEGIFILSILNAVDRWYRADGAIDPDRLVTELYEFVLAGLS